MACLFEKFFGVIVVHHVQQVYGVILLTKLSVCLYSAFRGTCFDVFDFKERYGLVCS